MPASLMYFCSGEPKHFCSGVDTPDRNRLRGKVTKTVYTGDQVQIVAQVGSKTVFAESQSRRNGWQDVAIGGSVAIDWAIEDSLVFPRSAA